MGAYSGPTNTVVKVSGGKEGRQKQGTKDRKKNSKREITGGMVRREGEAPCGDLSRSGRL